MKKLHVCTAFDRSFFLPANVMMHSVIKNTDSKIHFHLLIPKEDFKEYQEYFSAFPLLKKCLTSVYQVDNRKLSDTLRMSGTRHFSDAAIYRLLMTEYLPLSVDKILYLDGDLVINLDISEIYVKYSNEAFSARIERFDDGYFNSGVYLTSLNFWRDHQIKSQALEFLFQNPSLEYKDQDSLNHVFKYSNVPMEKKFNYPLTDFRIFGSSNSKACIFHFTGSVKPWKRHAPIVYPVKLWRSLYAEVYQAEAPLQNVKWSLLKRMVITGRMLAKF